MKKINTSAVIIFLLSAVVVFSSCANNKFEITDIIFETDENGILQVGEGYIALSVYGKDGKVILKDVVIKYKKNATVFDVTQFAAQEKEVQLEYKRTAMSYYVMGIDNLYEFDYGANSGWLFRVNGIFTGSGSGNQIIKEKDHIEWFYTTNLGADVGNDFSN